MPRRVAPYNFLKNGISRNTMGIQSADTVEKVSAFLI